MKKRRFVLIVTHENPYTGKGGTERYIVCQSKRFEEQHIDVLVLFPFDLRAVLNIPFAHGWGVVDNHKFKGIRSVSEVVGMINHYKEIANCAGVYIHNIIDLDIEELYAFIAFRNKVILYIHDYCTCCKQFNLRKNIDDFCGDSRLYDEKCNDCRFYKDAKQKHADIEKLFARIPDLNVIAPSYTAASLWGDSYPRYVDNIKIVPHLIPDGEMADGRREIPDAQPVKVAFVGSATNVKGWDKFQEAVNALSNKIENTKSIKWFYLGQSKLRNSHIEQVYVSTAKAGENAMINALREYKIDVVILFACWPETYSYTYFESLAAHCYVITSKASGNIAAEVVKRGNGIVIDNTVNALTEFLGDVGKIRGLVNEYRRAQPLAPIGYRNNINIDLQTSDDEDKKAVTWKGRNDIVHALLAGMIYKVRYFPIVTLIFPVYKSPKETLGHLYKRVMYIFRSVKR